MSSREYGEGGVVGELVEGFGEDLKKEKTGTTLQLKKGNSF